MSDEYIDVEDFLSWLRTLPQDEKISLNNHKTLIKRYSVWKRSQTVPDPPAKIT